MTTAEALDSAARILPSSSARCTPVGKAHISSSAHGSSRSATQGVPSSAARRAPAQGGLVGEARGQHEVGAGAHLRPSRTDCSIHQRIQRRAGG